jgi:hypothetical protein
MKKILYISLLLLLLISCSKNELGPQCLSCKDDFNNTSNTDVLIINEGAFGNSNGSITLYRPSNDSVSQNIFQQANNIPVLGDVIQSITQYNNKGYIVVNNSNKVEVVDINSFNSLATITGFNSPRYLLPVSGSKAYITDLYSNSIQIVNLNSNIVTGNISVNGWTEELIMYNDTVYVCDVTNNKLLIVNPVNDVLIDSVSVGENPTSIVKDKNNKIWILCNGGINSSNPELIKFNPSNRTIEQTFIFPNISQSPGNLRINITGDVLYYLNDGVYQFNISDGTLPNSPFISSNGNIYYGLGIDPFNNDVYVADAIDYIQNGIAFRFNATGDLIHQFNTGIIPNGFVFIQ